MHDVLCLILLMAKPAHLVHSTIGRRASENVITCFHMLTENPLGITMLSRTEITKYYSKYLIYISTLNLFYDEKKYT